MKKAPLNIYFDSLSLEGYDVAGFVSDNAILPTSYLCFEQRTPKKVKTKHSRQPHCMRRFSTGTDYCGGHEEDKKPLTPTSKKHVEEIDSELSTSTEPAEYDDPVKSNKSCIDSYSANIAPLATERRFWMSPKSVMFEDEELSPKSARWSCTTTVSRRRRPTVFLRQASDSVLIKPNRPPLSPLLPSRLIVAPNLTDTKQQSGYGMSDQKQTK